MEAFADGLEALVLAELRRALGFAVPDGVGRHSAGVLGPHEKLPRCGACRWGRGEPFVDLVLGAGRQSGVARSEPVEELAAHAKALGRIVDLGGAKRFALRDEPAALVPCHEQPKRLHVIRVGAGVVEALLDPSVVSGQDGVSAGEQAGFDQERSQVVCCFAAGGFVERGVGERGGAGGERFE